MNQATTPVTAPPSARWIQIGPRKAANLARAAPRLARNGAAISPHSTPTKAAGTNSHHDTMSKSGTRKIGSSPKNGRATKVPMTEAARIGPKVPVAMVPSTISATNKAPPMGAW